MTHITTAARRIAKKLNDRIECGMGGNGFCAFRRDGTGGAWYSANSRVMSHQDIITINIPWRRVTQKQVQEIIDAKE